MARPKRNLAILALLTLALAGCANRAPVSGDTATASSSANGYLLFRIGTGIPPGESMPEAYSKGIFQWSALVIRNVATGEAYRVWRDDRSWLDPELVELPPGEYYFDRVRTMIWASHDAKKISGPDSRFEVSSGGVTYVGEWRLVALIDRPFMKPVVRMDNATIESARILYPDVFANDPEISIVNPLAAGSVL